MLGLALEEKGDRSGEKVSRSKTTRKRYAMIPIIGCLPLFGQALEKKGRYYRALEIYRKVLPSILTFDRPRKDWRHSRDLELGGIDSP